MNEQTIDGYLTEQILSEILKQFGSPHYIFDERAFRENYEKFEQAMKLEYSYYRIAYSYKTNYTPYICKLVKELGGYAEVVSDMELENALRVKYDEKKIIYNGPVKGNRVFGFLEKGGIINVDSFNELKILADFLSEKNIHRKIGLRLNVDVEQGFVSRFGLDDRELDKSVDFIKKSTVLSIGGLHVHVGKARRADAWKKRVREVTRVIKKYFLFDIDFIDLGSGMYGDMDKDLANQFDSWIPDYSDYAQAAVSEVKSFYDRECRWKKPVLFTEPGTTLISKYIYFVSTVKIIKTIKGKVFIGLDCSIYELGGICRSKRLPIHIIKKGNKRVYVENADFTGYTCLEYDVMYKDFTGNISVGDVVVFGNVGGYSNVAKPPFILWGCGMAAFHGGNIKQIKKNESYDDVFRSYIYE